MSRQNKKKLFENSCLQVPIENAFKPQIAGFPRDVASSTFQNMLEYKIHQRAIND